MTTLAADPLNLLDQTPPTAEDGLAGGGWVGKCVTSDRTTRLTLRHRLDSRVPVARTAETDLAWACRAIDAYASKAPFLACARVGPVGAGAPPEMHAGPVRRDGWVECKVLASSVGAAHLDELEQTLGVELPSAAVAPLMRPLYPSTRAMLEDLFGP